MQVLAEWREDGLHVHCNVSVDGHWWISWAKPLRALVFRQKLPLVLDTLRYAERDLLMTCPQLLKAPVYVNFHGDGDGNGDNGNRDRRGDGDGNRAADGDGDGGNGLEEWVGDENSGTRGRCVRECWGALRDAGARGRAGGGGPRVDQRVSEDSIEAFSRARDFWGAGDAGAPSAPSPAASAASIALAAAAAATSLAGADKPQRNGGAGGGGSGSIGAGGIERGPGASRARAFAKNSMGASSNSSGVADLDGLGSPVSKGVASR